MVTLFKSIYSLSTLIVFIMYILLITGANNEFQRRFPVLYQFSKDYDYTDWAETIVGILQLGLYMIIPAFNTFVGISLLFQYTKLRDDAVEKCVTKTRKRLVEYAKTHANEILDEYKDEIEKHKKETERRLDLEYLGFNSRFWGH